MRLLQAMAGMRAGGAEGFFMRLTGALARAGVDQYAAIRTHAERRMELDQAGVPVTELRYGGPVDLISRWRLGALARRFDPDVIIAWMSRAAAIAPTGRWTVAARLGGYYDLKYFKRCDHLIGNTPDLRNYLVKNGVPEEKAWYLPNFVDDRRLPPVDRSTFETPLEAPLLLCLGRLHRNKGFDLALHALAKVPNAYLWIAGEGPERQALEKLAVSLDVSDRVRFLGWRNDAPALLAAADLFVCSSRHEPLGNIVIEAWAHATPVVAVASQGPSQLIEDGRNGLLTPMEDADALAKGMRRLLDDQAEAADLAGHGERAFTESFTEGKVVERYLDFLERIAPR